MIIFLHIYREDSPNCFSSRSTRTTIESNVISPSTTIQWNSKINMTKSTELFSNWRRTKFGVEKSKEKKATDLKIVSMWEKSDDSVLFWERRTKDEETKRDLSFVFVILIGFHVEIIIKKVQNDCRFISQIICIWWGDKTGFTIII